MQRIRRKQVPHICCLRTTEILNQYYLKRGGQIKWKESTYLNQLYHRLKADTRGDLVHLSNTLNGDTVAKEAIQATKRRKYNIYMEEI